MRFLSISYYEYRLHWRTRLKSFNLNELRVVRNYKIVQNIYRLLVLGPTTVQERSNSAIAERRAAEWDLEAITYAFHLRLIGKPAVDFLLVITKHFFARCYF